MSGLGGLYTMNRGGDLDNEHAGLKDNNVPAAQIQEMENNTRKFGTGLATAAFGQTIAGGALGYFWGRRAAKGKNEEPEASR